MAMLAQYLPVIVMALALLAIVAFEFVLPAKIIQKYNGNKDEPQLVDTEMYNMSIALLVLTVITGIVVFLVDKTKINILGSCFLIVLSAMGISKGKGDTNINNYHLYVISVCTLVFMLTGGMFVTLED